jgi:tripartite-type tricarboxylate transporter receptor subunit TctC
VRTLDDLRTREVAVAGPAPGTDGVTYPNTLNKLLGTRLRSVTGYRSGPEMVMAVERREVDGRGSWSWASFRTEGADMLKRGELQLLVQMSLRKSPELPDVPLIMEYAKTDEQKNILQVILTGQTMAWPLVAPAETPRERVELLRKTFLAMLADEDAKAEAKKLGIDIEPVSGAEIHSLLESVYATPPAIIDQVRELSGRKK